jgi:tetratricopeptide (TPR) repeat protein
MHSDLTLGRGPTIGKPAWRTVMLALIAVLGTVQGGSVLAQSSEMDAFECGALENAYGPFDYTDPTDRRDKLPIVEQFHFNIDVENLRRGQSSTIIGDLDYTLRAFPNHHRALNAMARYQQANPEAVVPPFRTAECYFNRALRFSPRDGTARMIYGSYLFKRGQRQAALQRYEEALALQPESAEAHYNMGLLQLELKRTAQALEHAHKAYSLGYPLQGLKNKLKRAGAWKEPRKPA